MAMLTRGLKRRQSNIMYGAGVSKKTNFGMHRVITARGTSQAVVRGFETPSGIEYYADGPQKYHSVRVYPHPENAGVYYTKRRFL